MGLHNITYKNKETEKEINAEMGKPFGLIEKLRLGGMVLKVKSSVWI